MKIRKVEISAFRTFDKVQDATFDFSLDGSNVADFISIYAPNGFGKTSFYDAVEWCITNQIERLHRNYSEYDKLAKENRRENLGNSYFLNHNGSENKDGYVKVETDSNDFFRQLPQSKNYDFRNPGQDVYFKEVILSQDLIDSFIKEEKAEERYNKFIKGFPSLNAYNTKLQNIIKLCNLNGDQIKELQKQIDQKEKSQLTKNLDEDEKVLEELNKNISFLADKGYNFELIDKDKFSDNEFKVFSNKLKGQITSVAIGIESLKVKKGNIDAAYNGIEGDEKSQGILVYFDVRQKKSALLIRLENFKELSRLLYQLDENKKALENHQANRETLLKIRNEVPTYLTIENSIKDATGVMDEFVKSSRAITDQISSLNIAKSDAEAKGNKIGLEINTIQDKLTRIAPVKNRLTTIDAEIFALQNVENLEEEINTSNKVLNDLEKRISFLFDFQTNIEQAESLREDKDLSSLHNDISSVVELRRRYNLLTAGLNLLNERIEAQENINTELKEFINRGLQIVMQNKDSSCPLCEQQYNSYVELSSKISNNRTLSEHVQFLLSEKVDQEREISTLADELKGREEIIMKKINGIHDSLVQLRNQVTNKIFKLLDTKTNLDKLTKEREELKLFFEGKVFEEFERELLSFKEDYNKSIVDNNKVLEKIVREIDNHYFSINSINQRVEKLDEEIKSFNKDNTFRNVLSFFRDQLNSEVVDLSLLNEKLSEVNKKIDDHNALAVELSKAVDKIKGSIGIREVSHSDIKSQIDLLEQAALLHQRTAENFEQFIRSSYEIDLSKIEKTDADYLFQELKRKVEVELRDLEEVLTNLRVIESLKEQTSSYLIAEKTKKEIQELRNQRGILQQINTDFNEEITKLQQFLKEKINEFFYTNLINSLYRKIDPHPDYEEVKFDCDFKDASARLQVYTKDKNGNYSVPALYFSSAQINILSLSIFLARALKATNPLTGEPIKCIFIDDPIQSMDSINILSFIDLFRSIVLNLDRQIIISTHEENFHLLLQKKIPKGIYKSKYIEFETFGRLRKELQEI